MSRSVSELRPFGVVLIAVLLAINGIIILIDAVPLLGLGTEGLFAAILDVVFGLALLYVAYGMWNLFNWAWITTLVLEGINALFALVTIIVAPAAIGAWISLILAAVIIFYLTRPEVHAVFHGGAARL